MQENTEPIGKPFSDLFHCDEGKQVPSAVQMRYVQTSTHCVSDLHNHSLTHMQGLTLYMNTCHHQTSLSKWEKRKKMKKKTPQKKINNKQTNKHMLTMSLGTVL